MKKLMMAFAVVACAAAVQASTVKWNVGNIYTVDAEGAATTTKAASGAYYVMCFFADSAGAATAKEISISDALAAATSGNAASLSSYAIYEGTTTGVGKFASSNYDGNWGADKTISIYALVFNDDTAAEATYVAANAAATSYTFADSAEDKSLSVSMASATWSAIGSSPTPIPEPTSGLFLLFGVAGLALLRKRA